MTDKEGMCFAKAEDCVLLVLVEVTLMYYPNGSTFLSGK